MIKKLIFLLSVVIGLFSYTNVYAEETFPPVNYIYDQENYLTEETKQLIKEYNDNNNIKLYIVTGKSDVSNTSDKLARKYYHEWFLHEHRVRPVLMYASSQAQHKLGYYSGDDPHVFNQLHYFFSDGHRKLNMDVVESDINIRVQNGIKELPKKQLTNETESRESLPIIISKWILYILCSIMILVIIVR